MSHTTYRILSCDGGGIRGVITAKLLQALDPSVIKNIDLFAGTSTGSIIALGLASGVPIDTIVELYSSQKACSKIFQPYLPLTQQDRLGRAFAAGEQALIATGRGRDARWCPGQPRLCDAQAQRFGLEGDHCAAGRCGHYKARGRRPPGARNSKTAGVLETLPTHVAGLAADRK